MRGEGGGGGVKLRQQQCNRVSFSDHLVQSSRLLFLSISE